MVAPLASPSFSSGPRNDLAVQDVYKVTNEKVVNNIQDVAMKPDFSEIVKANGAATKSLLKDTFSLLKTAAQFKASKGSMVDKLIAGSGALGVGLKLSGMSSGMLQDIAGTVKDAGTIYAKVGGITQRLKTGNFSDVASISNAIGRMSDQTGVIQVFNKDLTSSALGGVIKQATIAGIPRSFTELTKKVTDMKVIDKIIDGVMPSVVKMSDVGTLKEFAIASPGTIPLKMPSAISDFSFGYTAGPGTTDKEREVQWGEITATYEKVDPNWNKATRNGGEVVSVANVIDASPDLQKTISVATATSQNPSQYDALAYATINAKGIAEREAYNKREEADRVANRSPAQKKADDADDAEFQKQLKEYWGPGGNPSPGGSNLEDKLRMQFDMTGDVFSPAARAQRNKEKEQLAASATASNKFLDGWTKK
jgi:hypothetical protein